MTLEVMLSRILKREGGYTNHPADRGGPTNFGITLTTLSQWRGGAVTADDVKGLTEQEARAIYCKRFWQDPGYNQLPGELLQSVMLDTAVNHGPFLATKMLQRALGIKDDGSLGAKTFAAVAVWNERTLTLRLLAQRVRTYGGIITTRTDQAVFAAGWANRAAELIEECA